MRIKNGQEAIEFVLIASLVFFGALFVLLIFGGKISDYFQKSSSVVESSKKNVTIINPSDKPKYEANYETEAQNYVANIPEYNGETVDIKINNLVIGDVPLDIQEYVQTAGAEGATNQLVKVLKQISNNKIKLENRNKTENILINSQLKVISIYGHNLGYFHHIIENDAKQYKKLYNMYDEKKFFDKGLKLSYHPPSSLLPTGKVSFNSTVSHFNKLIGEPRDEDEKVLKQIVNLLADEINSLADSQKGLADDLKGMNTTPEDIDKLLKPNASYETNFRSSIYCAAGKGEDSGTKCD
ncbi:MAG: hypothetical protein AB1782_20485 [Cyanobacteriota bacterium]